jgi:hypothetical protein
MPHRIAVAASAVLAIILAACSRPPPNIVAHPTTQSSILRSTLSGCLVTTSDEQAIVAVSLPSLVQTTVRRGKSRDDPRSPYIHTLAGPDRLGRIVFVEGQMSPPRVGRDQGRHTQYIAIPNPASRL